MGNDADTAGPSFYVYYEADRQTATVPATGLGRWIRQCDNLLYNGDQEQSRYRLPIYKESPIKHKIIICEPLLSQIDFRGELEGWVEQVVAGGESGKEARVCNYDWVLDIRRQCVEAHVGFWFKQTGSYLLKDGHEYKVARQFQHSQARKAELNYTPEK